MFIALHLLIVLPSLSLSAIKVRLDLHGGRKVGLYLYKRWKRNCLITIRTSLDLILIFYVMIIVGNIPVVLGRLDIICRPMTVVLHVILVISSRKVNT